MKKRSEGTAPAETEWALLLACARTDASAENAAAIQSLIEQGPAWARLLSMAEAHGVTGLLSNTLSKLAEESVLDEGAVPPDVRQDLTGAHFKVARVSLRLSSHLQTILDAFEMEGIPMIPFKGPVLASTCYGDVALRTFGDLDLLVKDADRVRAREVLEGLGMRRMEAHAGIPDRVLFRWGNAESLLAEDDALVELHWRFANPMWDIPLEPAGLWERACTEEWMGKTVLSLAPEDRLHLLCTHGCRHAYRRLIWVADVAQAIRTLEVFWGVLLQRAEADGTLRMVLVGCGLAGALLDAPIPQEVRDRAARDPAVSRLTEYAARTLAGEPASPLGDYLFYSRTRDRVRDRLRFFVGAPLTPTLEDFRGTRGNLPPFLLPLLRPFRLARKYRKLKRGPEGWSGRG